MLTILHATCQTTMNTLEAGGNSVDATLLEDLRRMTDRTEGELLALNATFAELN